MTSEEEAKALDAIMQMADAIVEIKQGIAEMRAVTAESLDIAHEWQRVLGDPLKKGMYAFTLIKSVLLWITGTLLTLWGMREIFNYFFMPRIKL